MLVAIAALLIFNFASVSGVQAATPTTATPDADAVKEEVRDMAEYINEQSFDVSEEDEKSLLDKAKNLIESGEVNHHSGNDKIFDNPRVRGIEYSDGTIQYSVAFTYADEESMEEVSMLNVVFNSDKDSVFKTYEVDLHKNASGDRGIAKSWVDGQLDKDEVIDISNLSTEEPTMSTQGWTGCMSDCLAEKEISKWALTALGILCGVSCTAGVPATAGTACYACVNSAGIIGANAVFDCLEEC